MGNNKSSLKSTIAVSLTNYLDAGAIVAGASGLSLWKNYLSLTESHLGILNAISANCLGAAIGAIIGGFLADKYGRKAIYTYNMLIYMVGVLLVVFTTSFPMLLAGFLVTGVSVGVGVPASWTYISESSEIGNRGRNIGISQMAWGIGPLIILLLGWFLAPPTNNAEAGFMFPLVSQSAVQILGDAASQDAINVFSSRIVFASLFVVALIAWLLQRQLDESAEWKATQSQQTSDEPSGKKSVFASFGTLFSNKVNVRTMLFLAGMYLTWNLVSSVMGFFQQHIYETAGGLSNGEANMLSAGQWVIIVTVGIGSMSGLLFFTLLWGIQGGISVQGFYALWASELFPAKYRAAAQGVMFFMVRGLSAAWGLVFVNIYGEEGEGFTLAAYLMMALLVVSLLIGAIWTPKTRGKSLEQITEERYGKEI